MTDDLSGWLDAARPDTEADHDWAASPAGRRSLAAVRRRALAARPSRRRRERGDLRLPALLGGSLTAAAAVVVTIAAVGGASAARTPGTAPGHRATDVLAGPRPQEMALAAFDSCTAALTGLRAHTAAALTNRTFQQYQYGYGGGYVGIRGASAVPYSLAGTTHGGNVRLLPAMTAQGAYSAANSYSTTNTQEAGVGEPDVVETDGHRVVTVSGGVLRVIDATTRAVTGTLDLTPYAGASQAQLLMSGHRVLVLLGADNPYGYAQPAAAQTSTYLLVDVAHAPRIVSMLHPRGGYVDARMVGGEVRLVVRSAPTITVPPTPRTTTSAFYQSALANLPISTWLPSYDITTDGRTSTHAVPCTALRHPQAYTGASMLTVFSFGLADGFGDGAPLTVAGDGSTVYASDSSLYVAASDGTSTVLHRFDITRAGRPTYLGSGHVPGALRDSYSLSDYQGSLRVVTTSFTARSSALYVLDADTLRRTGAVGGLGRGEQVQAVRFAGAYGYVVTFRQVDPLYVLDLRNPAHPVQSGALEVSGYSSYLHPTDPGRLLGVGQDVQSSRVAGVQVSLFDVHDPARPQRIADLVRPNTAGETAFDPHAFLYWAPARTAVVPVQTWQSAANGTVLVVRVETNGLQVRGAIRNPSGAISRSLVVDGTLWTMSSGGLAVSDLGSLHRLAWIAFS